MPAGYAGTFSSAHVSAWRPTYFYLYIMPAGYLGMFNSLDISAWRPSTFELYSLPAGYSGTFNSSDASAWRPTTFYLYLMATGYAGTFNSSDLSAWRPTNVNVYGMPPATFSFSITAGGFAAWTGASFIDLRANAFSVAAVDQILADFYTAFATRTVSGGSMSLSGAGNGIPSGIFQAMCPPTTGKERVYELLNDSCLINPTKRWTTVTTN